MPRKMSNETIARRAGYSIREGAYHSVPGDTLGRWYLTHESEDRIRIAGEGYASPQDAWRGAVDQIRAGAGPHISRDQADDDIDPAWAGGGVY